MATSAARKRRAYRMGARAEAAERTVARIHDAAIELFRSRPFPEVTLQAVAEASGVTLQTILRRFGTKENLFLSAGAALTDQVMQKREVPQPAGIATIVNILIASYEELGDLSWRGVVQEDQFPLIKERFDDARAMHRRWVESSFAEAIGRTRGAERERRILLLFAATDFYVWKLYRRDLGLSRKEATARMIDLVTALVRDFKGQ